MSFKEKVRGSGFKQWQIADAAGISEATIVRWLRKDPPKDKQAVILQAIETLRRGGIKRA